MNQDKAREFFSAYHEGTLESGLRQQLEARLRADAQLNADYAAFVETIEALDGLRFEEIEIPLSLNDRIATRLEQEEAKRRQPVLAWTNWFRGLAFSGLAAAALVAAFVAIKSEGGPATAGLIPAPSAAPAIPADRLVFSAEGRSPVVAFRAGGVRTVSITVASSGVEFKQFALVENGSMRTPLNNSHPTPAILRVTATGDAAGATVIVPGTAKQSAKAGSGSVQEMATALSGFYGVPVVIRGNAIQDVVWNFEASTALAAAEEALGGTRTSVDQRDGGLITILPN
ncbi:MAG: anti-sigma factor family protein [Fimbriimonas sp.]